MPFLRSVEAWIDSALRESQSSLALAQIDRETLLKRGISRNFQDRLYRSLFVYSTGIHSLLTELGLKFNDTVACKTYWNVFLLLIQRCNADGMTALLKENERNHEEYVSELLENHKALLANLNHVCEDYREDSVKAKLELSETQHIHSVFVARESARNEWAERTIEATKCELEAEKKLGKILSDSLELSRSANDDLQAALVNHIASNESLTHQLETAVEKTRQLSSEIAELEYKLERLVNDNSSLLAEISYLRQSLAVSSEENVQLIATVGNLKQDLANCSQSNDDLRQENLNISESLLSCRNFCCRLISTTDGSHDTLCHLISRCRQFVEVGETVDDQCNFTSTEGDLDISNSSWESWFVNIRELSVCGIRAVERLCEKCEESMSRGKRLRVELDRLNEEFQAYQEKSLFYEQVKTVSASHLGQVWEGIVINLLANAEDLHQQLTKQKEIIASLDNNQNKHVIELTRLRDELVVSCSTSDQLRREIDVLCVERTALAKEKENLISLFQKCRLELSAEKESNQNSTRQLSIISSKATKLRCELQASASTILSLEKSNDEYSNTVLFLLHMLESSSELNQQLIAAVEDIPQVSDAAYPLRLADTIRIYDDVKKSGLPCAVVSKMAFFQEGLLRLASVIQSRFGIGSFIQQLRSAASASKFELSVYQTFVEKERRRVRRMFGDKDGLSFDDADISFNRAMTLSTEFGASASSCAVRTSPVSVEEKIAETSQILAKTVDSCARESQTTMTGRHLEQLQGQLDWEKQKVRALQDDAVKREEFLEILRKDVEAAKEKELKYLTAISCRLDAESQTSADAVRDQVTQTDVENASFQQPDNDESPEIDVQHFSISLDYGNAKGWKSKRAIFLSRHHSVVPDGNQKISPSPLRKGRKLIHVEES